MKNDDLIYKLSEDLKPVKPLTSPIRMTAIFVAISLTLIGMSFWVMEPRLDFKSHFMNPIFLLKFIFTFGLGLLALAWSAFLIRPGQERPAGIVGRTAMVFLFLVIIFNGFQVARLGATQIQLGLDPAGIHCLMTVLTFGLMLGAVVMVWLRRGASVNSRLSGFAMAIAGVSLGDVAISFFCGVDNGMHILIWHWLLPLGILSVCGIFTARYWLRW